MSDRSSLARMSACQEHVVDRAVAAHHACARRIRRRYHARACAERPRELLVVQQPVDRDGERAASRAGTSTPARAVLERGANFADVGRDDGAARRPSLRAARAAALRTATASRRGRPPRRPRTRPSAGRAGGRRPPTPRARACGASASARSPRPQIARCSVGCRPASRAIASTRRDGP